MEITETIIHKSSTDWFYKQNGVVFVDKKENVETVLNALIEQDDYWESYKELVKVAPPNMTIQHVRSNLEYVGKTNIDDIPALMSELKEKGIDIFIYSEYIDN